jgi:hypothetical protein
MSILWRRNILRGTVCKIFASYVTEKYNNNETFVQKRRVLKSFVRLQLILIFTFSTYNSMSSGGWCGRGDRSRVFPRCPTIICYDSPPAAKVSNIHYDNLRLEALMGKQIQKFTVPKKSAATWEMKEGDLCRITVTEGSQVCFFSIWIYKGCNLSKQALGST